jgi:hypothetical protein
VASYEEQPINEEEVEELDSEFEIDIKNEVANSQFESHILSYTVIYLR